MATREEVVERIAELGANELLVRKEMELLNREYNSLMAKMKICHTKIDTYEKERLSLEATLITIKKCKPRESGRTKKKPAKVDMRQMLSSLSKEERQALIAALSAM